MAQLAERSLPIPEVHGSNPSSAKIYIEHFTVNCIEKTKIVAPNKERETGKGPFLKKIMWPPIMYLRHYRYLLIFYKNTKVGGLSTLLQPLDINLLAIFGIRTNP